MAETEVVAPPPVPTEETFAKDATDKREGKPDRPKREQEEVPDMTVEEAQKALNALPKVCVCVCVCGVCAENNFLPEICGRGFVCLCILPPPAGESRR